MRAPFRLHHTITNLWATSDCVRILNAITEAVRLSYIRRMNVRMQQGA